MQYNFTTPQITVHITYETPRLHVKDNRGDHWFFIPEILYLKADGKYTRIMVLDNRSKTGITLHCEKRCIGKYEFLCDKYLVRCHRSFMINRLYFKRITPEGLIELHCPVEDVIPLGRGYSQAARLILDNILPPALPPAQA